MDRSETWNGPFGAGSATVHKRLKYPTYCPCGGEVEVEADFDEACAYCLDCGRVFDSTTAREEFGIAPEAE